MAFHKHLNMGFSELLLMFVVLQKVSPAFQALFTTYLSLNKHLPVHKSFLQRLDGLNNNKEDIGDRCYEYSKPIFFKCNISSAFFSASSCIYLLLCFAIGYSDKK